MKKLIIGLALAVLSVTLVAAAKPPPPPPVQVLGAGNHQVSSLDIVQPGDVLIVQVDCPPGEIATGLGFSVDDSTTEVHVVEFKLAADGHAVGGLFKFKNSVTSDRVKGHVMCSPVVSVQPVNP